MSDAAAPKKLSRLEEYYLTTNIKGVMILFLVAYHFISGTINSSFDAIESGASSWLLAAVSPLATLFLCATPIFVFITGYGSKDPEACRNTAFTLYLIPYFILTVIMTLEIALLKGLPVRFNPFDPLMQLWFLMSMFIWMSLLKDVSAIRFILPVSVVIMLVLGMLSNSGGFTFYIFGPDSFRPGVAKFLGLSRALYFFPFLLLGFFMTPQTMGKLRGAKWYTAAVAAVLFLTMGAGIVWFCHENENFRLYNLLLFKGDGAYQDYLLNGNSAAFFDANWKINLTGAAITVLFSILTLLLLFLTLRLIPKKKIPLLTQFGNASYTIFCLHVFIVMPLSTLVLKLPFMVALAVSIALSVLICLLLSINKVNKTFMALLFKIGDAIKRKKA